MKKNFWEVYEDNGGGLYLFVIGGDGKAVYGYGGFEYNHGELESCIRQLKNRSDAYDHDFFENCGHGLAENLDSEDFDIDCYYRDFVGDEEAFSNGGVELVADSDRFYPECWGTAACEELGVFIYDEAAKRFEDAPSWEEMLKINPHITDDIYDVDYTADAIADFFNKQN